MKEKNTSNESKFHDCYLFAKHVVERKNKRPCFERDKAFSLFSFDMTSTNFGASTTAEEIVKHFNADFDGKVIFITGATSGILN